jgi:monothiol glutaredoxin
MLSHLGVRFKGINVLEDPAVREGIKDYSDWPTIPQLYIKGEFVGGSDIMREMFESGELTELLNNSGIEVDPAA